MDVILRDDVEHLGEMGDVVRVKPGHARNLLIPRGLAVLADRKNLAALGHEKRLVEDRRLRKRKAALLSATKGRALRHPTPWMLCCSRCFRWAEKLTEGKRGHDQHPLRPATPPEARPPELASRRSRPAPQETLGFPMFSNGKWDDY